MIKAEDNITLKSNKPLYDNAQYFWQTSTGTDTGAHITEIPKADFEADPSNGGGNLLARSDGIHVRDGLTDLASFGADGMRIGKESDKHIEVTSDAFNVYDEDGSNPFAISTEGSLKTVTDTYLTTVSSSSDASGSTRSSNIYLRGSVQNNRFYVGVSTTGAPTSYTQYIESPTSSYKSVTVDGVTVQIKTIAGNNVQALITNTTTTKKYVGIRFEERYRETAVKVNNESLTVTDDITALIDSTGTSAKSSVYTYGRIAMLRLPVYNSNVANNSVLYSGTMLNYLPCTPVSLIGRFNNKLVLGAIGTDGTITIYNLTGATISPTASNPAVMTATYIFK